MTATARHGVSRLGWVETFSSEDPFTNKMQRRNSCYFLGSARAPEDTRSESMSDKLFQPNPAFRDKAWIKSMDEYKKMYDRSLDLNHALTRNAGFG